MDEKETNPSTLRDVVKRLRAPDGCPWDRKQTHASLKRYLIEESYECLEAIDDGSDGALQDELGDVLLQVMLHSQIAEERGAFDFDAVESGIVEKMIRRHPHVFGGESIEEASGVARRWEQIKARERGESDELAPLDRGFPKGLPACARTAKIQDRAAKKGFDWPEVGPVLAKIQEESRELEEAVESGDKQRMTSELGDLLFVVLKVARFLEIDAEEALNRTNATFVKRFSHVEKNRKSEDLDEMMALWREAKELE